MQLEKAQSGEAGLAGWISTNDVTLFTMILVVVIALVMNSRVIRGKSENLQLTDKNADLRQQNEQMGGELDSTSNLLATTRNDLARRQQELEQTNTLLESRKSELEQTKKDLEIAREHGTKVGTELTDALQQIDALMKSADSLRTEIAGVRQAKDAMQSDLTRQLHKTREDLTAELNQTKTTLENDKRTLGERLAALETQLRGKVEALRDAETQRDRLKQQADNLDAIVATLQQKLNLANTDMESLKTQTTARVSEIQKEAEKEAARAEDYLAKLHRAAEMFKGLQADKRNLQSEVADLGQRYEQQVAREATISRELVGVRGELRRVAFLFDASGSMKQRGTGTGDRWLEAQQIAATWLAHLDVDECVLVVFSTRVGTYPSDGTLLRVSGPEGEANRRRMLDVLNRVEPKGVTNTLEALRTAYGYEELDTIVLFSDGAPSGADSGEFNPEIVQQIYALCRQHTGIPVNTIGLGDYFDKNMGDFLRNLAQLTGGTFRGR